MWNRHYEELTEFPIGLDLPELAFLNMIEVNKYCHGIKARTPCHENFAQFPISTHKTHLIGNYANSQWPGVLAVLPSMFSTWRKFTRSAIHIPQIPLDSLLNCLYSSMNSQLYTVSNVVLMDEKFILFHHYLRYCHWSGTMCWVSNHSSLSSLRSHHFLES